MSLETELNLLCSCIPNGQFWQAKNIDNSNLRKLLTVFALENLHTKNNIDQISAELDIWSATEYSINLWERLVGLPDSIFNTIPTNLQDRINLVALKLFGLKIYKKKDLIAILEKLFPVLIGSGWYIANGGQNSSFTFKFPFIFSDYQDIERQNIYIYLPNNLIPENLSFTFTFLFPFSIDIRDKIKNVVEYIIPFTKNVKIVVLS